MVDCEFWIKLNKLESICKNGPTYMNKGHWNKDYIHLTRLPLSTVKCRLSSFSQCSVQSLNRVWLLATPWTTARQASLSITTSHSLLKPMSSELVMPSNHLILCRPLLLSIFPSIKVFSNESVLRSWWPKHLLMGPYFVKWKSEFRV